MSKATFLAWPKVGDIIIARNALSIRICSDLRSGATLPTIEPKTALSRLSYGP